MEPRERIVRSPFSGSGSRLNCRQNFGSFMLERLESHPKSRLIDGSTHEEWSYGEVARLARAVRVGLVRLGLGKDDMVVLLTNNRLHFLPAMLGAACNNSPVTFERPAFGADILGDRMAPLRPTAILCEPNAVHKAIELGKKLASVKHIIALGDIDGDDCLGNLVISWQDFVNASGELQNTEVVLAPPEYLPDHPCYLPLTSGTTGPPKVVVHTHETLVANEHAAGNPDHQGLTERDVALCTSVLGHVYALFDCVCKAIVQGASSAFLRRANVESLLGALEKHRVTALYTTPFMVQCLLEHPKLDKYDLQGLRHVTTATYYIAPDIAKGLFYKLRLSSFTQLYGQTEIPFAIAGRYDAPPEYGSMGQPALGVEAMIRHPESGEALGPHERGELLLRGPGVMRGYFGRMDQPATDEHGWLKTGDSCYYNDEGWLFLEQRMTELIKCRGVKMAPAVLESWLLRCPEVVDCTVLGLPDPKAGQVPHAIIVPRNGNLDQEHFIRFLEKNAPAVYHLEGGVTLTDVIPRNELGKVVRRDLVHWVQQRSQPESGGE